MRCGGNMLPGASRQSVKAGRYDGRSPWEAYHVKFRMAALTNDWGPTEKAGQLAAALEGEALQVLLDLGPDEVAQYEVLTAALERRFGRVEPAVGLRLQLANRTRAPGEKLGVLAADVRYLARRGYPTFPPATQEDLAVEAFVRGLTPTALRQQVRFAAPTSLELAVAHAERVEAVLEEGERDHAPGSESGQQKRRPDHTPPRAHMAQAEEEEAPYRTIDPTWPPELTTLIRAAITQPARTPETPPQLCWGCGQPGHLRRHCPAAAAAPPRLTQQPQGNAKGPA